MTREEQLEKALSDVLAIIDSSENNGAAMMAWVHGYRVDEEVSKGNGKTIEAAYELLGRKRNEASD